MSNKKIKKFAELKRDIKLKKNSWNLMHQLSPIDQINFTENTDLQTTVK